MEERGFAKGCRVCRDADVEQFCTAVDRVVARPGETWAIMRCRSCGFGWTSPTLDESRIAAYYPPFYLGDTETAIAEFHSGKLTRSRSWRKETEKVRLVEKYAAGGRLLDVGCGDGRFLWALDSRRWERFGIELSAQLVALVRSRMPAISLQAGDLHSDELAEGAFDVVTMWHALEHMPDPQRALRRAAALLGPGGVLFVSLPNLDSLQAQLFRRFWYGFDDVPRHLHHFGRRSLGLLLRDSGLKVQKQLMFSRVVNFHSLKHSLLHWSEEVCGGRTAYYVLKPALFAFPIIERLTGRYGILTTIAQKAPGLDH